MIEFRIDSGRICVAKRNSAGALTFYGRIARADHPMQYRSATGSRVEIIPTKELFRSDSLETFQTLPVTHGHPVERVMSPSNWAKHGKGSTHPTFVKEVTNFGTFLGQMVTVYDKEAADAIESGAIKGLSPGYSIDHLDQLDPQTFAQRGRKGNHLSIVEMPRGGEGVEAMLGGIRSDASDEPAIWVATPGDMFAGDLDDWCRTRIDSVLSGERVETGLIERSIVDLDSVKITGLGPNRSTQYQRLDYGMPTGFAVPSMAPITGAPSPAIVPPPCGDSCECDKCSTEKPEGFVMDDEMLEKIGAMMDSRIQAFISSQEALYENDAKDSRLIELEELLDEASELLDELSGDDDREDSDDLPEGALVFESATEFAQKAARLLSDFNQYRSDAALVGLESPEITPEAIEIYLDSAQDLQREVLAKVDPEIRTDSLEDEALDAVYAATMRGYRKASGTRNDSYGEIDRLQMLGNISSVPKQRSSGHRTLASNFFDRAKQEAR